MSYLINGWRAALYCLLACVACAGCGGGSSSVEAPPPDTGRPRALAVYFVRFMSEHQGRTPKDEAEFRAYLGEYQDRLQAGGMDVDQLLTSPQSGEPWVVAYGRSRPLTVDGGNFVAYESAMVDGKRSAVNERGGVQKIDDAKLQVALSAGK